MDQLKCILSSQDMFEFESNNDIGFLAKLGNCNKDSDFEKGKKRFRLIQLIKLVKEYPKINDVIKGQLDLDPSLLSTIDNDKLTLLHYATQYANVETLQILLDYGVNVDAQSRYGLSALHIAARNNNSIMVNLLCKNGANVNLKNRYNRSVVTISLDKYNTKSLEIFMEYDAIEPSPRIILLNTKN